MKILGIDPGYERLGIAVIEKNAGKEKLVFSSCFKTDAKLSFSDRLFLIGKEIETIIKKFSPDILVIEKLFFTTNQKTAMGVSEVKGIITYLAKSNGLDTFELTPLQVKNSIVGYGKADKSQVALMVKKILNFDDKKRHDDEYDAIALALTGSVLFKNRQANSLSSR